ncbi:hypothetical protein Tsubulata_032911 [Turnera subulata]|uniref:SKP1 component dimerisation domain-containing protein n=1 Tax=Turnera subulata TaxID=218843 RepID=A0A9Q0FFE0_9ROSI|nr:hypothetical protein Tsubulata_032911 [Turnera subulata]
MQGFLNFRVPQQHTPSLGFRVEAASETYQKKEEAYLLLRPEQGNRTQGLGHEFTKVDQDTLFDVLLASNYLDIKNLLDLVCQTVADMIKGKTTEEIRKTFHIKNDYTPEEEEEVRRENQWAFE